MRIYIFLFGFIIASIKIKVKYIMPRARKTNLSARRRNAARLQVIAKQSTKVNHANQRVRMAQFRASQTQEQKESLRHRRANRTDQYRENYRCARNSTSSIDLHRAAFQYNSSIDYNSHSLIKIGLMNVLCIYCNALKFAEETPGLCCLSGKVKLQIKPPPPEPLHTLLRGETHELRHFLSKVQKYKGSFKITTFGANIIEQICIDGYNFKCFRGSTKFAGSASRLYFKIESYIFLFINLVGLLKNKNNIYCTFYL